MLSSCGFYEREKMEVGRSTFTEIGACKIFRFALELHAVSSRSTVTQIRAWIFLFFFFLSLLSIEHDCSNGNEVEGCKKIYSCGKHALCGQKHGMPQCRWRMASTEEERKRERENTPFWFSVSSDSRKFAATTASRKCLSISFTQLVRWSELIC